MTTTTELRNRLENQGEQISRIAHQLEDRLESYKDWQTMVKTYPLQSVGVAAFAGLLASGAAGPILRFAFQQAGILVRTGITASIVSAMAAKQAAHQVEDKLIGSSGHPQI